ncbi:hypothetical protein ACFV8Z_26430 [Streptomyces sp. NPDC059837]|uniref:NrdR family transcriptional regulator n=1 Tax=Streptomyces sp. NPDC059837 TaxID=3346968 RepID=UPI0036465BBF
MQCPSCAAPTVVVARRDTEDGLSIKRRRQCPACRFSFTTIETSTLTVIKRAGVTEPFSRQAVITGVHAAAQRQNPIADASAGRARSQRRSRQLVCPQSERHSAESSWDSVESLFPLVAASGRG